MTGRCTGDITSAWITGMGIGITTGMEIVIESVITIGMEDVIEANFGRHAVSDFPEVIYV